MSIKGEIRKVTRKTKETLNKYFIPIKSKVIWNFANFLQDKLNIKFFKTSEVLSLDEVLTYYTPDWYHNFKILGVPTPQMEYEGAHEAQQDKQYIIFDYIKEAVKNIKQNSNDNSIITGIELFCADGFYSNFAVQNGVDSMLGVDLAEESGEGKKRATVLDQAHLITKLLGNEKKVKFEKGDVFDIQDQYDICLCLGGLYHLTDPEKLIALLRTKTKKFLIIQTVVSLETEDENYFETPCPGWTWGCRFSHKYLLNMLERNGWKILKEDRNEITWNQRLCDRGSSYILCMPQQGKLN